MIDTSIGQQIDTKLLVNYFDRLVNQFFKLLPIREKEAPTFTTYSRSLQMEVLGLFATSLAVSRHTKVA